MKDILGFILTFLVVFIVLIVFIPINFIVYSFCENYLHLSSYFIELGKMFSVGIALFFDAILLLLLSRFLRYFSYKLR
ncbi:hypothetical protein C4R89_00950 [Clostridioides difficile]|nr:hypothetical protein [Clostridioides difficile]